MGLAKQFLAKKMRTSGGRGVMGSQMRAEGGVRNGQNIADFLYG